MRKILLIIFFLISLITTHTVLAATSNWNKQVNYQGKLTGSDSALVADGDYNLAFRIYTTSTGGSAIWTEFHTSTSTQVTITNGLFSVLLGSVTSLSSLNWNQDLYLGVSIGASSSIPVWDAEMTPRRHIGAVPAAFEADRLDGLDSDAFIRADIVGTSTGGLLVLASTTLQNFTFANATGTAATTTWLYVSGATSTIIANGVNLQAGCFAINGVCVGGASISSINQSKWATSSDNVSIQPNSATGIIVTNSTTTSATTTSLVTTGTASSSALIVSGNASSTSLMGNLTVTGTAGFNRLYVTGATSTFASGVNLTTGCFSINSVCVGTIPATSISKWATSSVDSSAIYPAGATKVGIGTTTPMSALSITAGNITQVLGDTATTSYLNLLSAITPPQSRIFHMDVAGRYAYGVDITFGHMIIFEISPTASTTVISDTTLPGLGTTIKSNGRYAYIGYGSQTGDDFEIYDVSNPTTPLKVGGIDTGWDVNDSVVSGSLLFLAVNNTGPEVHVYDISDPANPVFISSVDDTNSNVALAVQGKYLFSSLFGGDVRIYDFNNPKLLKKVGDLDTNITASEIEVSGKYAYFSSANNAGGNEIRIFDISNINSPIALSGIEIGADVVTLKLAGKYLYAGLATHSGNELRVYDVSDPYNPVVVGGNDLGGRVDEIALMGRFLITSVSTFRVYDTTGIEAQSVVAHNLEAGKASVIGDLSVGGRAYVNSGLIVGGAGIGSYGPGTFSTYSTSTTAIYPALHSVITDTFNSSISDVLDISHMSTSTSGAAGVASGVGVGLTFSVQNVATTSTTTARISGILTNVSTTSPASALTFSTKNSSTGITEWARLTSTGYFGLGTTSPYAALSVVGPSGIVADKIFATSSMATSTFMGSLLVGTSTNTTNNGLWRLTVQGGICITSGNACPATESIGGLTVDTVDSTPDADDIGELFDLAERYFGSEEMAAGEIAALDTESTETLSVRRATDGDILVGVVSTAPAISINGPNLTLAPIREATSTRPNIALAGRVPVKVNLEGGQIKRGDRISASSEPGIGKKALPSEQTIGFAIQEWPNPDDHEDQTVLVYVNLSHVLSSRINGGSMELDPVTNNDNDKKSNFPDLQISEDGILTVREVHAEKLCLGSTCVTEVELRTLLDNNNLSTPQIIPTQDPAPEPEPEPEPVPPDPEVAPDPEPTLDPELAPTPPTE
ncbi:MAG: hypothetical protein AAB590_00335 [Patescibacteria group bacterium]